MPSSPEDQPEDQSLLDTDILSEMCASGEPLLAAYATILAWPKGGEPWPNRCTRERAASRTGGRSWPVGSGADWPSQRSVSERAWTRPRFTAGVGNSSGGISLSRALRDRESDQGIQGPGERARPADCTEAGLRLRAAAVAPWRVSESSVSSDVVAGSLAVDISQTRP